MPLSKLFAMNNYQTFACTAMLLLCQSSLSAMIYLHNHSRRKVYINFIHEQKEGKHPIITMKPSTETTLTVPSYFFAIRASKIKTWSDTQYCHVFNNPQYHIHDDLENKATIQIIKKN
jgi:hypothetical protein